MEGGRNYRQELGRLGEEITCDFLKMHGHTILERNWRAGHLEIDIISYDAEGIHFVEVKARRRNIQAPPEENVDWKKQKKIAKAALSYLNTDRGKRFKGQECMFDVAAVTFDADRPELEWFPQAYIPIYL